MKLITERLDLIPVALKDRKTLHRLFTHEYIRAFLFDDEVLNQEQVEEILATSLKSFKLGGFGLWMIVFDKKPIGFAGLWHFFEESQPQLIYALLPEFTGKGLAIEASVAVVRYAFNELDFDYVDASCDVANLSSQHTALGIGMKKHKEEMVDGKPLIFFRLDRL